jgi:hypothetical protein
METLNMADLKQLLHSKQLTLQEYVRAVSDINERERAAERAAPKEAAPASLPTSPRGFTTDSVDSDDEDDS